MIGWFYFLTTKKLAIGESNTYIYFGGCWNKQPLFLPGCPGTVHHRNVVWFLRLFGKIVIAPKALFRRWVPIQSLRFWDVRGMTLLCLFTGLYDPRRPPKPIVSLQDLHEKVEPVILSYSTSMCSPGKCSKSSVARHGKSENVGRKIENQNFQKAKISKK